jgi:hypothetical protein
VARAEHTSDDLVSGFFDLQPGVAVGLERYMLVGSGDTGRPPRYPCAYCYTDGAQSAAARLRLAAQPPSTEPLLLPAPLLVWRAAAALRLVGRSAVRNTGAFGDAVVEARLMGPLMLLAYDEGGFLEPYFRTPFVRGVRSRHTLPLQSLAGDAPDLLIAVRIVLSDIVNAFGLAELPHIAPDGTIRTRYFSQGWNVLEWAARHDVATTQAPAPTG